MGRCIYFYSAMLFSKLRGSECSNHPGISSGSEFLKKNINDASLSYQ